MWRAFFVESSCLQYVDFPISTVCGLDFETVGDTVLPAAFVFTGGLVEVDAVFLVLVYTALSEWASFLGRGIVWRCLLCKFEYR